MGLKKLIEVLQKELARRAEIGLNVDAPVVLAVERRDGTTVLAPLRFAVNEGEGMRLTAKD